MTPTSSFSLWSVHDSPTSLGPEGSSLRGTQGARPGPLGDPRKVSRCLGPGDTWESGGPFLERSAGTREKRRLRPLRPPRLPRRKPCVKVRRLFVRDRH